MSNGTLKPQRLDDSSSKPMLELRARLAVLFQPTALLHLALTIVLTACGGLDELAENEELSEENSAVQTATGPDLIVGAQSRLVYVLPGEGINFTVTVCNFGNTGMSIGNSVNIMFSTSGSPIGGGPAGSGSFAALGRSGCTQVFIPTLAPTSEGTYVATAIADPFDTQPEIFEGNNSAVQSTFIVTQKPDLGSLTVSGIPSVLLPGTALSASIRLCNLGTVSVSTPIVQVHLSSDSAITTDDPLLARISFPSLARGACSSQTVSVNGPSTDGTFNFGVLADPFNSIQEISETNNVYVRSMIVGTLPDFYLTVPPGSCASGNCSATVTVCNAGTVAGTPTVDLVIATDILITNVVWHVRTLSFASVVPGQCLTQSTTFSQPPLAPGYYRLGVIADPLNVVPELRENNNVKGGTSIGIGTEVFPMSSASVYDPQHDGTGDSFQAAPFTGLIRETTTLENRAMLEYDVSSFRGLAISSARLVGRIDVNNSYDVGVRSFSFVLYTANGTVDLGDFGIAGDAVGSASYSPPSQSSVSFDFNVTPQVRSRLLAGAAFVGVRVDSSTTPNFPNILSPQTRLVIQP